MAIDWKKLHAEILSERLTAENDALKLRLQRMCAPVSDEEVFAFSLNTLDPQESIPILIAARAAKE